MFRVILASLLKFEKDEALINTKSLLDVEEKKNLTQKNSRFNRLKAK